ncbi:hypothetical protein ABFS83_04G151700 [Erythranthe nasuta]
MKLIQLFLKTCSLIAKRVGFRRFSSPISLVRLFLSGNFLQVFSREREGVDDYAAITDKYGRHVRSLSISVYSLFSLVFAFIWFYLLEHNSQTVIVVTHNFYFACEFSE